MDKPADWKNYEDFAAGIDTYRLPSTNKLLGQVFSIILSDGKRLNYDFKEGENLDWEEEQEKGEGIYDAVVAAPDIYFLDIVYKTRARESRTLIVNVKTGRVLSVLSHVQEKKVEGEPLVSQLFETGILEKMNSDPKGPEPHVTRDLIGLRAFQRLSPNHMYEHTYLNSNRYCWQNLIGEQRGHGDVDLATYYKFDEKLYLFTFREFIIPVASVFFFNYHDMRSTGKFLGITGDGKIENRKAGAYIQLASRTFYDKEWEPV